MTVPIPVSNIFSALSVPPQPSLLGKFAAHALQWGAMNFPARHGHTQEAGLCNRSLWASVRPKKTVDPELELDLQGRRVLKAIGTVMKTVQLASSHRTAQQGILPLDQVEYESNE